MAGSGMPIFAAAVISRPSLEKTLERFLSWAPLRNWMFLNFEWPAIESYWLPALSIAVPLIRAGTRKIHSRRRKPASRPGVNKALTLLARQDRFGRFHFQGGKNVEHYGSDHHADGWRR